MLEHYNKTGSCMNKRVQQGVPLSSIPLKRSKSPTPFKTGRPQKKSAYARLTKSSPIKQKSSGLSTVRLSKSSPNHTSPLVEEEDPYAFPDDSSSDTAGRSTQTSLRSCTQHQRRDVSAKLPWDNDTPGKRGSKRTYSKLQRSR